MDDKPVKCINCDTWNLPEAKFCKSCGENLDESKEVQEALHKIEMMEHELKGREALVDKIIESQQESNSKGGCASVILILLSVTGIGSLIFNIL